MCPPLSRQTRRQQEPSDVAAHHVAAPVSMSARARARRPIAAIERILYTREEAATALGMSVDTFERRVQPFIRVVPCGALVQVPPDELRRWARENARAFFKQST
jgi:hypothetical protein